jgi:hypothetical protein
VGSTVAVLAGLAKMSSDRSTRDGRRLAPQSFRLVDQEITTPPWKTGRSCGDSRLDSSHEPSEPAVGSTPHSRRTAQVGDQDGAIDGAKYLRRPCKPPSQTWRAFLVNHAEKMASIDFFTVPTATFRVLFVFVVLSHARRRVLHFQVTEHPNQEWTMQQIREAFPWEHCGIEMQSMAETSPPSPQTRGWRKWSPRRERPGRIPMWNGLWVPSGENVWTTSSSGINDRYAGSYAVILPTTSIREPI